MRRILFWWEFMITQHRQNILRKIFLSKQLCWSISTCLLSDKTSLTSSNAFCISCSGSLKQHFVFKFKTRFLDDNSCYNTFNLVWSIINWDYFAYLKTRNFSLALLKSSEILNPLSTNFFSILRTCLCLSLISDDISAANSPSESRMWHSSKCVITMETSSLRY